MSRPEYKLVIRYNVPGDIPPRNHRTIPWNWYPSPEEVYGCIRRLRAQEPEAEVLSATLYQTVLVERYAIGD